MLKSADKQRQPFQFYPSLTPLAMSSKGAASARTKRAGALLMAQQESDKLGQEKKQLKASLKKLALEKKRAQRKARSLKAKAAKINLTDLLQMMMMKAFVVAEEQQEQGGASSSSSSSGEAWKPKNPREAFDKIVEVITAKEQSEVASFASQLRTEASP